MRYIGKNWRFIVKIADFSGFIPKYRSIFLHEISCRYLPIHDISLQWSTMPFVETFTSSTMVAMVSSSSILIRTSSSISQNYHALPLPSLNQVLTIRWDRSNYLLWKMQLLNVSIVNGLEFFIEGLHPCPSLMCEDGITINSELIL